MIYETLHPVLQRPITKHVSIYMKAEHFSRSNKHCSRLFLQEAHSALIYMLACLVNGPCSSLWYVSMAVVGRILGSGWVTDA